jgi:hypothetical protein
MLPLMAAVVDKAGQQNSKQLLASRATATVASSTCSRLSANKLLLCTRTVVAAVGLE